MTFEYLTIYDLMFFNKLQIETFSPGEPIGVLDNGSLEMIVEQPKATVFGEEVYQDVSEKAGIMFINIIKKHPFQNANKRTAAMALDVFIDMNGYQLNLSNDDFVKLSVDVAIFKGEFDELKDYVFSILKKNINQK